MNEIAKLVIAIVAALGGAGGVAKIIKELVDAAKLRADAKKESHCDHQAQSAELTKIREALQSMGINLTSAQSEAQALREDIAAKDKKIAQLEKTVMQQAAALPPAVKPVRQKD
jgi:septal ring factor EnvC (AmiA/AmiB activator)